jgi:tetratricopeptide (TPR) repeat protein
MELQKRIIDLNKAIGHIKQARGSLKGADSPFFFIVGSGISYPPVPLAYMIVEHCKNESLKLQREHEEKLPEDPMEKYSYYFEHAYPQAKQRQTYLRTLIEGKPISKANLRLAHLISEDDFTDIIVTPNFDDFLARGLALFGKPYVVCDHPFAISRLSAAKREDIKIIQVHGSYWFYDCANLSYEIENRAKRFEDNNQNMSSYLGNILDSRSPLIVGYSGWEKDVIMSSLKRRLQNPLGTNLYWFCYRKSNVDDLPDWLKSHPDVRFVVPPLAVDQENEKSSGSAIDKSTLSGQRVFDIFIKVFGLSAPRLTREPLSFFADQLERSLLVKEDQEDESDIYLVGKVVEDIRRADRLLNEQVQHQGHNNLDIKLETVRDAWRRLSYQEVVGSVSTLLEEVALSNEQLEELKSILWNCRFGVEQENWSTALKLYENVIGIIERLEKVNTGSYPSNEELAEALIHKGIVLGYLHRSNEEIAVYDDVIGRFGESSELILKKHVAWALMNKGITLKQQGRFKDNIPVYDEIIKRYENSAELDLQEQVARAFVDKGFSFGELKQYKKQIQVYDRVIKKFVKSTELVLQERVVRALVSKGYGLGQLNRFNEAISTLDEVVKRYRDSDEPVLQEGVLRAKANKAEILARIEAMIYRSLSKHLLSAFN